MPKKLRGLYKRLKVKWNLDFEGWKFGPKFQYSEPDIAAMKEQAKIKEFEYLSKKADAEKAKWEYEAKKLEQQRDKGRIEFIMKMGCLSNIITN